MTVLSVKATLYAPQCHSLKEKRMVLQSVIQRVKNKFNVSIAEVDMQDSHQILVLGIAVVSESHTHARKMLDNVLQFIESHSEAEIIQADFE